MFKESAAIQVQKLWERLCVFIVTAETTLLRLPSRVEAVNEAAATVARLLNDLGITDDASFG
ncbi:MAG: hypothetical protein ACRD6N_09255, partial [Pyrinomonadaceae bacterium]